MQADPKGWMGRLATPTHPSSLATPTVVISECDRKIITILQLQGGKINEYDHL